MKVLSRQVKLNGFTSMVTSKDTEAKLNRRDVQLAMRRLRVLRMKCGCLWERRVYCAAVFLQDVCACVAKLATECVVSSVEVEVVGVDC